MQLTVLVQTAALESQKVSKEVARRGLQTLFAERDLTDAAVAAAATATASATAAAGQASKRRRHTRRATQFAKPGAARTRGGGKASVATT